MASHHRGQMGMLVAQRPMPIASAPVHHGCHVCGSMSYNAVPDPTAYERGNYMKVLGSYTL